MAANTNEDEVKGMGSETLTESQTNQNNTSSIPAPTLPNQDSAAQQTKETGSQLGDSGQNTISQHGGGQYGGPFGPKKTDTTIQSPTIEDNKIKPTKRTWLGEDEEEISVEGAYLNGDLDNLSKKEQKEVDKFQKQMNDPDKRKKALEKIKWKIGDNVTVTTDFGANADRNGDHEITKWEDYLNRKDEEALANTVHGYGDMTEEKQQEALKEAFQKHNKAGDDDTMNFWDYAGAKVSAPFERMGQRFNNWRTGKTEMEDLDGNETTTNWGTEIRGSGSDGEITNKDRRKKARREKALIDSISGWDYMNDQQKQEALVNAYNKANKDGEEGLDAGEVAALQLRNGTIGKLEKKLYGGVGISGEEGTTAFGTAQDRGGDGKVGWWDKWRNSKDEKALAATIPGFEDMSIEEKRAALADAYDRFDTDNKAGLNAAEYAMAKMSKANKSDEWLTNKDGGVMGGLQKGAAIAGTVLTSILNPFKAIKNTVKYGTLIGQQNRKAEEEKMAKMTPEEKKQYLAEKEARRKAEEEARKAREAMSAKSSNNKQDNLSNSFANSMRPKEPTSFADSFSNRNSRLRLLWDRNNMKRKSKMKETDGEETSIAISDGMLKDYVVRSIMNDNIMDNLVKLIMLDKVAENKVQQTPNGNIYYH